MLCGIQCNHATIASTPIGKTIHKVFPFQKCRTQIYSLQEATTRLKLDRTIPLQCEELEPRKCDNVAKRRELKLLADKIFIKSVFALCSVSKPRAFSCMTATRLHSKRNGAVHDVEHELEDSQTAAKNWPVGQNVLDDAIYF